MRLQLVEMTDSPIGPVPTENSIALKKREQHSRGNEFLGLRKHLSNRRVVNDPPYRLPEQRITTAGSIYILKRKRWLKLPVVRIGGEVLPPAAVQRLGPFLGGEWHALEGSIFVQRRMSSRLFVISEIGL